MTAVEVAGDRDWVPAAGVRRVCEVWLRIFAEHGQPSEYRFTPGWVQTRRGLVLLGARSVIATSAGCWLPEAGAGYRLLGWDDLVAFPQDWQIDQAERSAMAEHEQASRAQWEAEFAALSPEEQAMRVSEARAYLARES